MLAFLREWREGSGNAERMATSLALHAPGKLRFAQRDGAAFALVPGIWGNPALTPGKGAVPALLPSGDRVLFTGWFDNLPEVARQLGLTSPDPAVVYGHAVERWGDETECRVIGAYAAVIDRPRLGEVRLARSPITAPPLHYHRSAGMVAAACVPRALIALGIPAELDEDRVAMHLHAMPFDRPGGWYKGIEALQLGMVVNVTRDGERRSRPYSLESVPEVRLGSDREYQEAAEALLDEAVDRTIAGYRQPGTFLSGGLDSSIVASHMLDRMPAEKKLPTFTFLPEEGWGNEVNPVFFPDERPYVEAFAAMHPRIEAQFVDNAGKGFEDGLDELFLLSGMAPASLPLIYPYHGMFAAARSRGCDLLVGAGMGNTTFSNDGMRGYVEYLHQFRLRDVWRALSGRWHDDRPVWRQFVSLSLIRALPEPLWRAWCRLRRIPLPDAGAVAGALNPGWLGLADLERAARAADASFDRPFYRSREDEVASMARQMDADAFDLMQGLQQRFGIAYRDVTRYRPFVEFCWGLPTDQFLRGGETRWLARRMGEGRLPEAMRTEQRRGFQHQDWHLRIGRRREALLAELKSMRENPKVARLVDCDRLIGLLENFPESSTTDLDLAYQYMIAVPNGVAMGRFIRFVEGTNV
ncbi:MAG: hypothetical protein IPG83_16280 [Novosphingobium sp.]|jgi:asparagine synthase (glutamine-hydrolysing)|nr:hypothetical protein [Novosphingobium sp.]